MTDPPEAPNGMYIYVYQARQNIFYWKDLQGQIPASTAKQSLCFFSVLPMSSDRMEIQAKIS